MLPVPSDDPGHGPTLPTEPPQAAEAYASLGWRTVPIAPGRKHPQLPEWQKAATDDLDTIRNWYTGLYKGHGVGIATGEASGLWVLDVDIATGKQGAQSLAALNETHGRLPPTVTAATGTGGLHLFFTWDPNRPITNGLSAHLGPGLDIRGQGGQVVAAPTLHPDTGRPYTWRPGRDPWSISVADAPDWLYNILLAPEPASSTPAVSVPLTAGVDHADSPAEWIRTQHDWHPTLTADGWTIHSTHGDQTWWTRPGKERRDGHSAVLHEPDGPLVIFTTEIPTELSTAGAPTADGSGISVSMFGYIAGTRHNGDRSAAARHARQQLQHHQPTHHPAGDLEAVLTPTTPAPAHLPQLPAGPDGFTDLADWWDNPEPTLTADTLTLTNGAGLLYRDQLNWIHGDSGSGKTWVLLLAAHQLIAAGHHVAWVHYEDPNPAAILGRLKLLGANRQHVLDRFHYWDPQGEPLNAPLLLDACTATTVVHVGLDSIGEALNAQGLNEDSDHEVGPWIVNGPRLLVNHSIGVTCLDHGTKDTKHAPLHPSGSKRKRAAITGAGHLIKALIPPTRTTSGRMQIVCGKDRHGNHPQGQIVGTVHLDHNLTTGGIDLRILPPVNEEDEATERRIRDVVRMVAQTPGVTRNQLLPLLNKASATKKHHAIDTAIQRGEIVVTKGPRNAQQFHINDQIEGGET